ncbi:MAG: hypothetical protein AAGC60_25060 [Acidobacteriota bacterium]
MKYVHSVLILSCLVAVPLAAQGADPERPERLVFAWPDGAEAEVTYSVNGWRRNGGNTTSVRRTMKYRMIVRAHGALDEGELEVERVWPGRSDKGTSETSKDSLFGKLRKPWTSGVQTLIDDLPELVPRLRVTADGRLASIGGMDEIEQRRDRALDEAQADAATRRQVNALVSEESLYLMSVQSWAALVTIWHGRHLGDDFPFGDRSGADVPSEPLRVEVPGNGRFDGWVPCTDDETAQRCVKLHWSAAPQGEDAEEAVEALEGQSLDDLELTREITVVVEPTTLLPHSTVDVLKAKRTVRRGSETMESSEEMTRTRRFSWTVP